MLRENTDEYDISQEIDQILDDIVEEKVSESDKQKFKKNILLIFRQNTNKLVSLARNEMDPNIYAPPLRSNNSTYTNQPSINIILLNQANFGVQASPIIGQPINTMVPNTNMPSISPYQIPNQSQPQMLPYQQPFINPSIQTQPTTQKKSKKHHHHDKSEKHHKDEKSEKHHKDKKSDKSKKKSSKKGKSGKYTIETTQYQIGHDFEGIFNFLTTKFGLNPHDKGVIEITTNSMNSRQSVENSHPKNLINFGSSKNYKAMGSQTDVWVCFNFKSMEVEISSYSIKSSMNSLGHIKNWAIEISDDGAKWEVIDSQNDCGALNSPGSVQHFNVTKKAKFSRLCRFRNTGSYWGYHSGNSGNGTYVEFNSLEFFGKIKMPKDLK